jgi:hypothetical protein
MFEATSSEVGNGTISSFIIKAVFVLPALTIACCIAASASTAIDVTYGCGQQWMSHGGERPGRVI